MHLNLHAVFPTTISQKSYMVHTCASKKQGRPKDLQTAVFRQRLVKVRPTRDTVQATMFKSRARKFTTAEQEPNARSDKFNRAKE